MKLEVIDEFYVFWFLFSVYRCFSSASSESGLEYETLYDVPMY